MTAASGSQLSAAVANPVFAGSMGSPQSIVASGGQTRSGGVVSTTVMTWSHDELLPAESVAVQVRVMLPPDPESPNVICGLGSQSSVAVAIPVSDGSVDPRTRPSRWPDS